MNRCFTVSNYKHDLAETFPFLLNGMALEHTDIQLFPVNKKAGRTVFA